MTDKLTDSFFTLPIALSPSISRVKHQGEELIQLEYRQPGDGFDFGMETQWKEAAYLVLDVVYPSDHSGMVEVQFFARGDSESRFSVLLGVFPNLPTRLSFPLAALDGQQVFLERTPGRLKGLCLGRRIALEDLGYARLSLRPTGAPQSLIISSIYLAQNEPDYPVPDRTIVDPIGQWIEKVYPGKIKDEVELKANLAYCLNRTQSSIYPQEWSEFGGYKQLQFKSTGFFRTEHDGKRWWLVDPQGCAFFSAGIDCVRPNIETRLLAGMEKLLTWLPERVGTFKAAFGERGNSLYFDFGVANLIRAFGRTWHARWRQLTRGRLVSWRFNTVGNWSDLAFTRQAKLPYVLPMRGFPNTTRRLFRDFPDIFSPEYRRNAIKFARQLAPYAGDPYLIGYFLTNEPHWGFGAFNLAAEMLEVNPGTHTRRELARWMREKYLGDVSAWSKAWGIRFKRFNQLTTGIFHRIGDISQQAFADLWEFSRLMVHTYARIPCEETRRVAPHHLNLGLRYAWIASDLMYSASEFFDVFTINNYDMFPPLENIREIANRSKRPVLIGEYHFGALDRGLPSSGLRRVESQSSRGIAYRRYFETCAADPNLVGVHYFQLNDQSVLGRYDGENFQIGFVDGCHSPYIELVEEALESHERMYSLHMGDLEAFPHAPAELPRIAF